MHLMGNASLSEPGQCLSTGAAAVVAVNLKGSGQGSAAEQGFNRTNEAVGAAAHTFSGAGANGDITKDCGAAAQAEVGRTIGPNRPLTTSLRGDRLACPSTTSITQVPH